MNNINNNWKTLITQPVELSQNVIDNHKKVVWNHLEQFQKMSQNRQHKKFLFENVKEVFTQKNMFSKIWGYSLAGVTAVCIVSFAMLLQPKSITINNQSLAQNSISLKKSNVSFAFNKNGDRVIIDSSANFSGTLVQKNNVNLLLIKRGYIRLSTKGKLNKPLIISSRELSVAITGTTLSFNIDKKSTFELLEGSVAILEKPLWNNRGVEIPVNLSKAVELGKKINTASKIIVSKNSKPIVEKVTKIDNRLLALFKKTHGKKLAAGLVATLKKSNVVLTKKMLSVRSYARREQSIPLRPNYLFILKNGMRVRGQLINQKNGRVNVSINGNIMVLDKKEVVTMKELLVP